MLPLMEHFLSTNFFMDCSPRKLGKADPLPLSSLILRSERFVNSDMLKGIGPCNKDPSICNVVSLFNFPQKAGSLPEKLVLEILNFSIRMRRPISGGIDPWNSLPSISRSVRVVIFVSTMGNGPDNLFPFSTLHEVLVTSSGPTGLALHHGTNSCLDVAGGGWESRRSQAGARRRSSVPSGISR